MNSIFFAATFLFLCLPSVIARLFRMEKIFPLVFVQLVVGLLIKESGALAWLRAHDVDVLAGPLGFSLQGLGWIGVVIMIALAGSESMSNPTSRQTLRFLPISVAGFFSTFVIGSFAGYLLVSNMPGLMGPQATPVRWALTLGVTLAVTALPVLISILRETRLATTEVGKLAVNCAMLDDVWLWLGIALILSSNTHAMPGVMLGLLVVYGATMFLVVKPVLKRWHAAAAGRARNGVMVFAALVCLSAMVTDLIGLHPLLGAFVAGVVLPKDMLQEWREPLATFSHTLLLPFYFVVTGMRLQLDFGDPSFWMLTAFVTTTAVVCKCASVTLAGRALGLPWRDAGTLGCLMQCKGLMELIAINIFLDAGIIGPQIYSALAMMALISTLITAPSMTLLTRRQRAQPAAAGVAG
ncbi:cation:proton antiporter [Pseudoduganella buxea]|uniref:Cation/H+ exchanger transmembrane domain-containing protein n=2 Tax=Pseudoduganella buxea TaxID=1949069 RepID=A0A6I3T931_9BURK|nr:cation:proton antiporter [Pseudoduganella buxea]MTV56147.1 hypothetical protein [Pseudoduganella buxea]